MRIRWHTDGVASIGSTIVGSVSKNDYASMYNLSPMWHAYGALCDYDDTKLGTFDTEEEAKSRVEEWVKENTDESDWTAADASGANTGG